jgi:hypothetical protein
VSYGRGFHLLIIVSSRFNKTLPIAVQAASSLTSKSLGSLASPVPISCCARYERMVTSQALLGVGIRPPWPVPAAQSHRDLVSRPFYVEAQPRRWLGPQPSVRCTVATPDP